MTDCRCTSNICREETEPVDAEGKREVIVCACSPGEREKLEPTEEEAAVGACTCVENPPASECIPTVAELVDQQTGTELAVNDAGVSAVPPPEGTEGQEQQEQQPEGDACGIGFADCCGSESFVGRRFMKLGLFDMIAYAQADGGGWNTEDDGSDTAPPPPPQEEAPRASQARTSQARASAVGGEPKTSVRPPSQTVNPEMSQEVRGSKRMSQEIPRASAAPVPPTPGEPRASELRKSKKSLPTTTPAPTPPPAAEPKKSSRKSDPDATKGKEAPKRISLPPEPQPPPPPPAEVVEAEAPLEEEMEYDDEEEEEEETVEEPKKK